MARAIYLAGKITPYPQDDWRFAIVDGLKDSIGDGWMHEYIDKHSWRTLPMAILRQFDYVGPFFTDLAGVGHGGGLFFDHGLYKESSARDDMTIRRAALRNTVVALCLDAIARADLVFAWIDDPTCYATLFELGVARGLGKDVVIMMPPYASLSVDAEYISEDFWFILSACDSHETKGSLLDDLQRIITLRGWNAFQQTFNSPLEAAFADEWVRCHCHRRYPLVAQYSLLQYRLDFAFPSLRCGIELDGYTYHSARDAFNKDRQRQRDIEALGWRIIRFSGDEIRADVTRCVYDTITRFHLIEKEQTL